LRAFAGAIKHAANMFFLSGRYLKDAFEGFNFGAGHTAIGFGHLGAQYNNAHSKSGLLYIAAKIIIVIVKTRPRIIASFKAVCIMDMADQKTDNSANGSASRKAKGATEKLTPDFLHVQPFLKKKKKNTGVAKA
jgi:hypothetical protein